VAAAVAPRARQGGFVDPVTLSFLVVAGAGAAIAYLHHPNYAKIAAATKIPVAGVQSAWKWSRVRGLPFAWVLATIIVESGGNPRSQGDAGGKSKGLMQVNTEVHAKDKDWIAAGVHPDDMFNIDKGVEWGTKVMKEILGELDDVLKSHHVKTSRDVSLRLSYKGPSTVKKTIIAGREPSDIPWAHEAIVRWHRALTTVSKVV
jgi:soluble lytic murein transglycosylase-like protein